MLPIRICNKWCDSIHDFYMVDYLPGRGKEINAKSPWLGNGSYKDLPEHQKIIVDIDERTNTFKYKGSTFSINRRINYPKADTFIIRNIG